CPTALIIHWRSDSEAVDKESFNACSCRDPCCLLQDQRGDPSVAKLRPDINCSDPRRILGAMNAVVFDDAATSNWFALGQSDHAIRHSIQFRVAPEPVENKLGRVASLAPPLFVDPAPNGVEVLWALR